MRFFSPRFWNACSCKYLSSSLVTWSAMWIGVTLLALDCICLKIPSMSSLYEAVNRHLVLHNIIVYVCTRVHVLVCVHRGAGSWRSVPGERKCRACRMAAAALWQRRGGEFGEGGRSGLSRQPVAPLPAGAPRAYHPCRPTNTHAPTLSRWLHVSH